MLKIEKKSEDNKIIYKLEGRLDTSTSPDLEKEVKYLPEDIGELVFDLEKADYISSAGLRVILAAQKIMTKQGEMKVINVNDTIMEIFEVTGFTDILTIE